jgi:hypothetical protein
MKGMPRDRSANMPKTETALGWYQRLDNRDAAGSGALNLLIALFAFACQAAHAQFDDMKVSERYAVTDSRFPADYSMSPPLPIWIDNDTILFHGVDLEKSAKHSDRPLQVATYVWSITSNKVTKYRDERLIRACLSDGVIHYVTYDDVTKEAKLYEGSFGFETERHLPPMTEWVWNPFDCSVITGKEEPVATLRNAGRRIVQVRVEHGYVDVGPDRSFTVRRDEAQFDYRLGHAKRAESIKLEVDRTAAMRPVQWMPFSGDYLFTSNSGSRPMEVWKVSPKGTARKYTLPRRDWISPTVAFGVRNGIAFVAGWTESTTPRRPGTQGLYLLSDREFEWLEQGHVSAMSVSPDGCKLTYVFAPSTRAISENLAKLRAGQLVNTLRFIELCRTRS